MNVAFVIAVFTASVNLVTAVGLLAISRAPGWKFCRTFAFIAFTGVLYSVNNTITSIDGFHHTVYHRAVQLNYLWANLHILAWYPFLFGGPDASLARLSRPLRWLVAFAAALALFFLVTDLHLRPGTVELPVAWAGVVYHYCLTTPIGDAYGLWVVALLLVPYASVVRRLLGGDLGSAPLAVGFSIYFACALVEVLVANRVIVFVSPADLGFLAIVIPTAATMLRRFIADQRRLQELTARLEGEVAVRTEERDLVQSALVESERLAALGRLAAGVGHEINNPLTYVQLSLERVDEQIANVAATEGVRESLADARDGVDRIRRVVEDLRIYSRRRHERVELDPRDVARSALRVARPNLRHVAHVETEFGDAPRVLGEEARLVQALVNLLVNAAQAVGTGETEGRLVLRTRTHADGSAVFEVEDNGPGIPEEHQRFVAEPYWTTRAERGGLGLGLFVTRGIVDAHAGRLELEGGASGGTIARVVLPACAPAPSSDPAASPAAPHSAAAASAPAVPPELRELGPRHRVLVVDDEPLVLRLVARALERDWDVLVAADGAEARAVLERGRVDAIVCDLLMPGVTGMDLAAEVEARSPALRSRMVFLTGGAVTEAARRFVERPDVACLTKPVELEELRGALRRLLERAPRPAERSPAH